MNGWTAPSSLGAALAAASMLGHGLPKLIATDTWPGPTATGEILRQEGLGGGRNTAVAAGVSQCVGGLLAFVRPDSALGPTLSLGSMVVAADVKRPNGFWSHHDGAEYPLVLAALAAGHLWQTPQSLGRRSTLTGAAVVGGLALAHLLRQPPETSPSEERNSNT